MWENVVGPALEDINPKLNPETESEVDELLATVRMLSPIFSKYAHNLHNLHNLH